ncbi:MAG: ATP-dependent Clp protease ATP-binding subunit, partial [Acidobacteria bacterium]|nr:ATP-dependent Clp protease ATP-binding subunit [Acidobacteriota bacterium]
TLTDAYGNQVDFKNTLVLMTSNLGSKFVLRSARMGFGDEEGSKADFRRIEDEILSELRRAFSPEFINRVDEVIVFNPLGSEELRAIVDILLADVNHTLGERGLGVEVDQEAKEWLLEKAGVDPSTGARPLRRTIQRYIQDAVSEILITHHGETIERIVVDVEDGVLRLRESAQEVISNSN